MLLVCVHLQVRTATNLVKHEGVGALWKGLPPALVRGLFYGGERAIVHTAS